MSLHHGVLVDAIENRLQVCFRYKASDEDHATVRVVEPWIYGSRNGKECLYGFQLEGGVKGPRRYDLRRVGTIEYTGEHCENHPDHHDMTKWDVVVAKHIPRIAA